MHDLLDQIESSLGSKLYYLSLFATLCIPDMGGAADSEDGYASGKKYVAWYETWARPQFRLRLLRDFGIDLESPFDGVSCYQFRCSLLHQGRGEHVKSKYERIVFFEPGVMQSVSHYNLSDDEFCIDLPRFCQEMLMGARAWLKARGDDPMVAQNLESFVRRHPTGLSPHFVGAPLIG